MLKYSGGFHRTSNHRRDNFSMDIKNIYSGGIPVSPFLKKNSMKQKLSLNIKHHLTSNTSMDNNIDIKKGSKRRLSLTKTSKHSNFGQECYFYNEKIKKIEKLIYQQRYEDAIPIIRQLISKDENCNSKNKLYLMHAQCLMNCHKLKQAQQYFTKFLSTEPNHYMAIVNRGKIRYEIGAKQLGLRDLRNAMYLDSKKSDAYLLISHFYTELNNKRQAINILLQALHNKVQSLQIIIKTIQLISDNPHVIPESQQTVKLLEKNFKGLAKEKKVKGSQIQCFNGLICEYKHEINEACIFFEECLKFNNCRFAETIAVEHLIIHKISQRDYYAAYHIISRLKILSTDEKYLTSYTTFLDGVVLVMKKKYQEGIKILENLMSEIVRERSQTKIIVGPNYQTIHVYQRAKIVLEPLAYKFLAFASFKIGKHEKAISYYEKLLPFGHDQCSSYNLMLAEGIVGIEKKKNFQAGIQKFQQAKYVYPNKAEPYIYIAMTILYREIFLSKKNPEKIMKDDLVSASVHAIEQMNEAYDTCGNNSSNLLFHRSILHLFLGEFQEALDDINQCIEKAEQNQPKYFYIRGLCYAIVRQMKKAINEFSISLSLNSQYQKSLLERAKCFFLLGETESGFNDLKIYMQSHPDDYQVHKWIGDLLYSGYSYNDAYKAYQEIDFGLSYQAQLMKSKCLLRMGTTQNVTDIFNKISKMQECDTKTMKVDILALNLLKLLTKSSEKKDLIKKIKQINTELQENNVGVVFQLIDCMNLLGLGSLQLGNYEEAYQSFLLASELFPSYQQKYQNQLKSELSEQNFSLSLHDIYLNSIIALIGMKSYDEAIRLMKQDFLAQINSERFIKYILKLIESAESEEKCQEKFTLESYYAKNQKIRIKSIDLRLYSIKIKCVPNFSLFHKSTSDLYANSVVNKIVKQLHPSYIDNMPEGPWIKRNQHGVVFTDNMIESDIGSSLISSMRDQKANKNEQSSDDITDRISNTSQKKKQFMKKMALDPEIQKKLNSIITKGDKNTYRSS